MAQSTRSTGNNIVAEATLASAAGGLAGLLDAILKGETVPDKQVTAACKLVNTMCNVARIALQRERLRMAQGVIIEGAAAPQPQPNGSQTQPTA